MCSRAEQQIIVEALFSRQSEFADRIKTIPEMQEVIADPDVQELLAGRWEAELQALVNDGIIGNKDDGYYLTEDVQISLADDPANDLIGSDQVRKLTLSLGSTGGYYRFRGALLRAYQHARQQATGPEQISIIDRLYQSLIRRDHQTNIFALPEYAVSIDQLLLEQQISSSRRQQLVNDLKELHSRAVITIYEFPSTGLCKYRFPVNRPEKLPR